MKILLIEDDQLQQNSAKKELGNHRLIIAKSREEARVYWSRDEDENNYRLKESFDLIITDLVLPPTSGVQVDSFHYIIGIELFAIGLQLIVSEQIKGLALVSNFEHHLGDNQVNERCTTQMNTVQIMVHSIGKRLGHTRESQRGVFSKTSPESLNVISWFDLNFGEYTHMLSPDGEELLVQNIRRRYGGMQDAAQAGYVLAKPFKRIVDELAKG